MMDLTNQGSSSSRKRGRPQGQARNPPVENNLIGQVFSGVVEGSFEAGYFLNVKVLHTDKHLKGIVFLPNKVAPLTPATDLFPEAKMYLRENILTPSSEVKRNADDLGSDNLNQTAMLPDNHPMSLGSEAIDERNHHTVDTEMNDASAEEKLNEPEGQTLSLMPQFASSDDIPHTVLRSEPCVASKAVTCSSSSLEDSVATTFLDFFPAPATTNVKQATGSSSSFSLELFQNETNQPDEKSPEPRVKSASPVDDEELQLELGNKKMNASAIVTEAKSGLLVDLFESREEETVKEPEESHAGAEAATQRDDNDS